MSSPDAIRARTDFDDWIATMVADHGEFTVLVILTEISERRVAPLCSTFLHVIGDEVDWSEITGLFASAGKDWDGAAFFPTKGAAGGPTDNKTARSRLAELENKVMEDRMVLNEGHFFDVLGRRIEISPIQDS